ncbi:NUDIX hydrolase [Aerococcus sanguinicola]|uniref:NUDIX domain-containing protein n=2 Tax=Aerococcus sanguinicola TaxID=119206 RepID=A0A2I1MST8_9LACT|nr:MULTISPECIES: NUDIX domain-containing protein [Aerococcus]MDK7049589.1 NUDIX domain-containing protein [Aerococcus sanguinicola]PKZ23181.1 NUDIX domain-containing protein [Aerococcus sanguinicola]
MSNHHLTPSAGILILTRECQGQREVLLQHRANTKMLPQQWDLISGHVEAAESVRQAIVREAKEEIGIELDVDDLDFVLLSHNRINRDTTYYNIFFTSQRFQGQPHILEPEKHDALDWFPLDDLPSPLVKDRKLALEALRTGQTYVEVDFDAYGD